MINNKSIIEQRKDRKIWIDSLRAFAMILVVYGHCVRDWTEFFIFTSPVKMPLFFVISGYLFNSRDGDIKSFLKNLLLKLVVPWLVLGMIHPTNPLTRFLELLSGKVLWFMPCLIIGEIVWFFIRKFAKYLWMVIASGMIFSTIGYALSRFHILDFAMFNTALIVQLFFIIGYLIRINEDLLLKHWKWILSSSLLLYLGLTIMSRYLFPGRIIDVHHNQFVNVLYSASVIPVGCLVLFITFRQFNIGTRWLSFIGQNTLVIYIVHGLGINIFARLVPDSALGISLPVYALLRALFALLMCSVLAVLFNRFLPELVGKKRACKNESK